MKKSLLITTLLLFIFNLNLNHHVLAQATDNISATPSAQTGEDQQPSPADDEIEKIRQAVKEKVKQKIDQIINKPNQKIGWVGQITEIDENQISLICLNKQDRTVVLTEDTAIINTKRQTVDTDQLKVDQIILVMGYINTESQLEAKRILITNKPLESLKNTIILTTITDISQTTSVMTLVSNDRQVFQVKTDKNTKDLVKNQKIIAILKPEDQDSKNWQIVDFKLISPISTPTPTDTQ